MTWTHNGAPLGPKPRPWRLTRRQRVEMEAALARLRACPRDELDAIDVDPPADILDGCGVVARVQLRTDLREAGWVGSHYNQSCRILRARVAIALRAALRSDEDARCEEANARFADDESETLREMCGWRETRRAFRYDRRTLDEIALLPLSVWTWASWSKAESARGVNESGERLYAICIESTVPLALWERAR